MGSSQYSLGLSFCTRQWTWEWSRPQNLHLQTTYSIHSSTAYHFFFPSLINISVKQRLNAQILWEYNSLTSQATSFANCSRDYFIESHATFAEKEREHHEIYRKMMVPSTLWRHILCCDSLFWTLMCLSVIGGMTTSVCWESRFTRSASIHFCIWDWSADGNLQLFWSCH